MWKGQKCFSFSENWNTITRMSRLEPSHYSEWAILALVYRLCQYLVHTCIQDVPKARSAIQCKTEPGDKGT
jgi:hypothetical protein